MAISGASHLASDDGDFLNSVCTDNGFRVFGECWLVGTVASKPETLINGKKSVITITVVFTILNKGQSNELQMKITNHKEWHLLGCYTMWLL
jgi:hypothetical protein